MATLELRLADALATEALGAQLAVCSSAALLVFLQGQLGAGKTTLVRGFLRALGHTGPVKSPTYALLEPYSLEGRNLYHLDLYRLRDAEELEWIGIRDLLDGTSICLIEWPERGTGLLPEPDVSITLEGDGEGRAARLSAGTSCGEQVLDCLSNP
ncbi:MAG: tRNA (adenosine(37)-N6)-threonylcarbamoyltransferase complex ATPase subunit type 1 TsaE [Thiogranum sp.]|nr:tRNA (adenosine(37)-N6)-threonylcarbamoyltransferase complex ATPase subunit type 1 TsaE [Thiogranum sp.]